MCRRQRNKGVTAGNATEHPWSCQCYVSLENSHDSLTGIATVVTVGSVLWEEPLIAGSVWMPGRGQQFGYCWGPVDPGRVVVDGGVGRDKLMSEQFRKGSVLSLQGQEMMLRKRGCQGRLSAAG